MNEKKLKEFLNNHKKSESKDLCKTNGCYFIGYAYTKDFIYYRCSRCGTKIKSENTPMTI